MKITDKLFQAMEKLSTGQIVMIGVILMIFMIGLIAIGLSSTEEDEDHKMAEHDQTVQTATNKVFTAKSDIQAKTLLTKEMLKEVDMPVDLVPPGTLASLDELEGKYTTTFITAGEVLTSRKVLNSEKEAGFTGMIPSDMRALSIPIDDSAGVGGFARPGDYVDVIIVKNKGERKVTGEILLQNVLLLAINRSASTESLEQAGTPEAKKGKQKEEETDKPSKVNVDATREPMAIATIALRPEKALRLLTEAQGAKVALMLRPFKPKNTIVLDTDYTIHTPLETPSTPQVAAPPPVSYTPPSIVAPPKPEEKAKTYGIEIIRGIEIEGAN